MATGMPGSSVSTSASPSGLVSALPVAPGVPSAIKTRDVSEGRETMAGIATVRFSGDTVGSSLNPKSYARPTSRGRSCPRP
jgi:hypothetical protein